jgi:hypothetical protein
MTGLKAEAWECCRNNILNQTLPLLDLETIRNSTKVHGADMTADLTADAAGAELVGHRGGGVEGEFDAATLAASFEFPVVAAR